MSATPADEHAERRARRLIRAYPGSWRRRYGEEFTQLLVDDIHDRPHAPSRTVDVIRSGLRARLAAAGLAGCAAEPGGDGRAGLAALSLAAVAFLTAAIATWSQLTIGWQWSAPSSPATRVGMLVMSAAMAVFGVLVLLASGPVLGALTRELVAGRGAGLAVPLGAVLASTAVVVLGSVHFGHGWPGTGGHPWPGRDLVPGGVARIAWAATAWITSYWVHPAALATFPATELAWMLVSPAAIALALTGAAVAVRRLPLSPGVLRWESWVGWVAALTMAAFLAGCSCWVLSGGPGPRGLFRVGTIDGAGVVVMALALVVAFRAARSATPTRAAR